jgi:hypothetical protein
MTTMWRWVWIALVACSQPKQPLQASFFTQKRPENAPLNCKETLDCYGQCKPLVEECMLLCDQRSITPQVTKAREVSYCSARNACADDQACTDQYCGAELQACVAPRVAPAPSPMRPAPVMRPPPTRPPPGPPRYGPRYPPPYPPPPPRY